MRVLIPSLLLLSLSSLVACSGENAKQATAAVVGKGIEVSKGTVTGIAAGIEEGRKQGESADGAVIISSAEELATHGGTSMGDVTADGEGSTIAILVSNTGDKPLRLTRMDPLVLDSDSVVVTSRTDHAELTVPPKAKAKLIIHASVAADKVGTVRLFGVDVPRG